jgi:hypothetical protein
MTRIDKVEPGAGNFRAPIDVNFAYTANLPDMAHADLNKMICVSLNANGRVVRTTPLASPTGLVGVICLGEPVKAGFVVDVMQTAELVEFTLFGGGAAASGTPYFSNADGAGGYSPGLTPGATIARLGHTVEATRFILRLNAGLGARAAA